MKVLLLANQPERTTRLIRFRSTLEDLGHEVVVPRFETRNWWKIGRAARDLIKKERPDVVHLFNVPDIIYNDLPNQRDCFGKLIYDYRSPWGIETAMRFGPPGKWFCERYEAKLAREADAITTVNGPLKQKVSGYARGKDVSIIPNYPSRSFIEGRSIDSEKGGDRANEAGDNECGLMEGRAVIFVGRVCEQEGISNFIKASRALLDREFWIVGDGPFAWLYLKKARDNVKFMGWQSHDEVARLVRRARICTIPREENALSPYSTDKSIWKLNEYLNLGKLVLATGVSKEEDRKNLIIARPKDLIDAMKDALDRRPEGLNPDDFRFWEGNRDSIRAVYESL